MVSVTTRTRILNCALRLLHLNIGSGAQLLHSVPSIQSQSDFLILLDETLQLVRQVSVLICKGCAVKLKSVNFSCQVPVAA